MLVAGLQVFEEIDFIKPCVQSCCELFDQVVVLEGSWSTTASIKGKRSSDGTIEQLELLCNDYDNLELVFYNGINQISHRSAAWNYCKKYNPDWYLQGDGDEIFHEKDKEIIKETLSLYKPLDCVAPQHYLFWHDLEHYEEWNTAGARFFNTSGLNFEQIKAGPTCNQMNDGKSLFKRHVTNNFFIYHPSYAKRASRQDLKIKHRSADDGVQFPHMLLGGKMYRNQNDWFNNLQIMQPLMLPKYLRNK